MVCPSRYAVLRAVDISAGSVGWEFLVPDLWYGGSGRINLATGITLHGIAVEDELSSALD